MREQLTADVVLRPATIADAAPLSEALQRSREHLRPWEPRRSERYFTVAGQEARLRGQLEGRRVGHVYPWVLVRENQVVGTATLSNVSLGPFRSANLGYWVAGAEVGRGLATAAVQAVCRLAGEQLSLHRIEAGTLLANRPSQRVLEKCGFELIGTARNYLHIDGAWRDHLLFQRILNADPPAA